MPARASAGLLVFRRRHQEIEVFLVHPGGPYWARKDLGAWTIPKGEIEPGEEPLAAACREFREETGSSMTGEFLPLRPATMKSGKVVHAWAVEGDIDPHGITSTTFSIEWPPRSGRIQQFPEVDRAAWFAVPAACERILPPQVVFLDELVQVLAQSDA